MCAACYARWQRSEHGAETREKYPESCTECGAPSHARGLCNRHYQKVWRKSRAKPKADVVVLREVRRCDDPDCDRKHYAHGMCLVHYRQWRRGTYRPAARSRLRSSHEGNGW